MNSDKWNSRFIGLAAHVAAWSKDPSTRVGAVIVRPNRTVAGVGYNGLPRGVDDSPELLADREYKYARTVHAELNAIFNCAERPDGCTLYVYPLAPCTHCAAAIIQAGITSVHSPRPSGPWEESGYAGSEMLMQAGVRSVFFGD